MTNAFVESLDRIRVHDDRAALAALRAGLGRPGSESPRMYPYVVRYLPADAGPTLARAYFRVAALFGMHPGRGRSGVSLGRALRRMTTLPGVSAASVEQRVVALLDAHVDDLDAHLRHTVALLRQHEIDLDWERLVGDLAQWTHPDGYVQRRIGREFWSADLDPEIGDNP